MVKRFIKLLLAFYVLYVPFVAELPFRITAKQTLKLSSDTNGATLVVKPFPD
jgi:hypothetical protein